MDHSGSKHLLEELIANRMENTALLHDQLAENLIAAGKRLENSLNSGGKLCFIASTGLHKIAAQAVDNLMSLKLSKQPAIPAILLNPHQSTDSEYRAHYDTALMQLEAIANDNDCIVFLEESASNDSFKQLNNFLTTKTINCVSILHLDKSQLTPENDHEWQQPCWIPLFDDSTMLSIARKQELSLFILNCLTAMIEQAMFGAQLNQSLQADSY